MKKLKDIWNESDIKPLKPVLIDMLQDAGFTEQQIREMSAHQAMNIISGKIQRELPNILSKIIRIAQREYALTETSEQRAMMWELFRTDEPLRKETVSIMLSFAVKMEKLLENLKQLEDLKP